MSNKENNMKPETIKIDDQEYVRADSVNVSDSPVRIVILQRGWVMVGRYRTEGEMVILENAKVIRKWGTTKGLGELVDGPIASTVLDPAGHVECHILGVVASISCREGGWDL